MKIGIISDIHSNIIALKACVKYMESVPCDEYLFLGDYVSDTPYTRETMDYLYDFSASHSCLFLRGNREEYMLEQREILAQGIEDGKWTWNSATGNLLFTYRQLREKDFLFFESLPIMSRYYKAGIAIGTYGYAHCMIMEDARMNGKVAWNPAFLKIPYDNEQVVQDIKASGLLSKAPWFVNSSIQTLLTGADYSAQLVGLANKLAREAGEQDFADEKYWREAARQLGVPDYR